MKTSEILRGFGLDSEPEPESIYPFSPVYRVTTDEGDVVVKKTQSPLKRAKGLIKFISHLSENGIDVVTPVELDRDNPQTVQEDVYVVYPYINGSVYTGKNEEIYQAGRLLGQIHGLSPAENHYQLDPYNVYDFTTAEVEESMAAIGKNAAANHFSLEPGELKEKLMAAVSRQDELERSGLPCVASPYDYKANNLIYTPEPYLIDPDNATWVPRIFDLALALLLFHNEHDTAPARIFTAYEWQLFLKGYTSAVELTEQEKSYWQQAVEHIFLDEVMWLMEEFPEDWENSRQRRLFADLIRVVLDCREYGIE
ncbi:phosphotransferase [Lentibacillus sediminis]|uniref:phosphotransferase n=1 Tax=Lentibacillus sediminis TaxID=1940529 RepID=UPI000C1B899F|nr:phosphotransferase [Lentibacillus sediminis]